MATVSLGGTLSEKIDAIAGAGFDGIELGNDEVRACGESPGACARRCADAGLSIELFQPFRRAEGVPDAEFATVRDRFRGELDVMAEMGAASILVVSNTDSDADAARSRSIDQVGVLADEAAEYGITLMFEALAWGTHINHVTDAWEVVHTVDSANVSLVIDTFHLVANGENEQELRDLPPGAVGFLQVADAPFKSMDLKQWSRGHRCFPGEGEFDLVAPIAVALENGYTGPLSLEIFNPEYRRPPACEVASRGAEALARLERMLSRELELQSGAAR